MNRTRKAENRRLVIAHLGNVCVWCGFSDSRALHIDHIDGGGHKERRTISEHKFQQKVLVSTPGVEYQLLCANCNTIKKVENNEVRVPNR